MRRHADLSLADFRWDKSCRHLGAVVHFCVHQSLCLWNAMSFSSPPNDAKYKLLLMLMLLLDDDADADAAAGRVLGIPYSTPCPTPTRMKYP